MNRKKRRIQKMREKKGSNPKNLLLLAKGSDFSSKKHHPRSAPWRYGEQTIRKKWGGGGGGEDGSKKKKTVQQHKRKRKIQTGTRRVTLPSSYLAAGWTTAPQKSRSSYPVISLTPPSLLFSFVIWFLHPLDSSSCHSNFFGASKMKSGGERNKLLPWNDRPYAATSPHLETNPQGKRRLGGTDGRHEMSKRESSARVSAPPSMQ